MKRMNTALTLAETWSLLSLTLGVIAVCYTTEKFKKRGLKGGLIKLMVILLSTIQVMAAYVYAVG